MATFLIERNIPGASDLTPEQLRDIAVTSNKVVDGLGVGVWLVVFLLRLRLGAFCASAGGAVPLPGGTGVCWWWHSMRDSRP